MKRMRRFLCKLGFHGYRLIGFHGLMLSEWLEMCDTCGKGRMILAYGSATCYYSPEQMKMLLESITPSLHCTPNAPPR